ncbi:NADH:ubiquinone reductase (H(+)-translocating) [Handroanthus impetiginosus]|uniref:NADH:ubiquinone reductase (H(+)-translocating) n=1 Tax=Handroanthus impetiginosus TaxID=429701 RepID=A0A2G9G1G2_9LAMI|nr:NADH:ubiquinone reductase (H(+)-translocating) [Handroanthus impetiginosus]
MLDILSLGAILSGILVITSKSPVISVLFLISVFVNVAGYLVLLGVGFIGISYIVVYVGAVTVLFLFVIMMINIELSELNAGGSEYTQNVPLAFIMGSVLFYEFFTVISSQFSMISSGYSISTYFKQIVQGTITYLNVAFFGQSTMNISNVNMVFNPSAVDVIFNPSTGLQVHSIGSMLYTHSAMWLIIASVILLLAIIAPITLSKKLVLVNLPNCKSDCQLKRIFP